MTSTIMQAASLANMVLLSFEGEALWIEYNEPSATLDRYGRLGASQMVVKDGENL